MSGAAASSPIRVLVLVLAAAIAAMGAYAVLRTPRLVVQTTLRGAHLYVDGFPSGDVTNDAMEVSIPHGRHTLELRCGTQVVANARVDFASGGRVPWILVLDDATEARCRAVPQAAVAVAAEPAPGLDASVAAPPVVDAGAPDAGSAAPVTACLGRFRLRPRGGSCPTSTLTLREGRTDDRRSGSLSLGGTPFVVSAREDGDGRYRITATEVEGTDPTPESGTLDCRAMTLDLQYCRFTLEVPDGGR